MADQRRDAAIPLASDPFRDDDRSIDRTRRSTEQVIPLVEETLRVDKREVETGRVRIRTLTDERTELARADLTRTIVDVERVPVGRDINAIPPIRDVDGKMIIPIVSEELVVSRKLVLVEELHITSRSKTETFEEPVTLRSQRAEIDRDSRASQDVRATADITPRRS